MQAKHTSPSFFCFLHFFCSIATKSMPRPPGRTSRLKTLQRRARYATRFGLVLLAFLSFYMSQAEALPTEEIHLPTQHTKQVEELLDVHTEVTYPAKSSLHHRRSSGRRSSWQAIAGANILSACSAAEGYTCTPSDVSDGITIEACRTNCRDNFSVSWIQYLFGTQRCYCVDFTEGDPTTFPLPPEDSANAANIQSEYYSAAAAPAQIWDFPEYNLNLHPAHKDITTTGPTGNNYYTCPAEDSLRLHKLTDTTVGACMQKCVDDVDCHFVSIWPKNTDTLAASGDDLWERPANFMDYSAPVQLCFVCDEPVPSTGNNNDNGWWTVWGEIPPPPSVAPTTAPTKFQLLPEHLLMDFGDAVVLDTASRDPVAEVSMIHADSTGYICASYRSETDSTVYTSGDGMYCHYFEQSLADPTVFNAINAPEGILMPEPFTQVSWNGIGLGRASVLPDGNVLYCSTVYANSVTFAPSTKSMWQGEYCNDVAGGNVCGKCADGTYTCDLTEPRTFAPGTYIDCVVYNIDHTAGTATFITHNVVVREYNDDGNRNFLLQNSQMAFDMKDGVGIVAYRNSGIKGYIIKYTNGVITRESGELSLMTDNQNYPDLNLWSATNGVLCARTYSGPMSCVHLQINGNSVTASAVAKKSDGTSLATAANNHNQNNKVAGLRPDTNMACYMESNPRRGVCHKMVVDTFANTITAVDSFYFTPNYPHRDGEFSVAVSQHDIGSVCYLRGTTSTEPLKRYCRAVALNESPLVVSDEFLISEQEGMMLHEITGGDSSIVAYREIINDDYTIFVRPISFPAGNTPPPTPPPTPGPECYTAMLTLPESAYLTGNCDARSIPSGASCQVMSPTHECDVIQCSPNDGTFDNNSPACSTVKAGVNTEKLNKYTATLAVAEAKIADYGVAGMKSPMQRKKALAAITSKAVVADSTNQKPVVDFADSIKKHTDTIADPVKKRQFRAKVVQLVLDTIDMAVDSGVQNIKIDDASQLGFSVGRELGSKTKVDVFPASSQINGESYNADDPSFEYAFYAPLTNPGDTVTIDATGGTHSVRFTNVGTADDTICGMETRDPESDPDFVSQGNYTSGETMTWDLTTKLMKFTCGSVAAAGFQAPLEGSNTTYVPLLPDPITIPVFDANAIETDAYFSQAVTGLAGMDCTTDKVQLENKYKELLADQSIGVHADSLLVRLECSSATDGSFVVGVPGGITAAQQSELVIGLNAFSQTTFVSDLASLTAGTFAMPVTIDHAYTDVHANKQCGNGKMEALDAEHQGRCPMVGSLKRTADASTFTAETCDSSSSAFFGVYNKGCGETSDQCMLNRTATDVDVKDADTADAMRRQLASGVVSAGMANFEFDSTQPIGNDNEAERLNICLYSSKLLKADNTEATTLAEASHCSITAQDLTTFTTLTTCYNSDTFGIASATINELQLLGKRYTDSYSVPAFQENGHKCQWPVSIRVTKAVGGPQTWNPVLLNSLGQLNAVNGGFEGMYDVEVELNDPSWPNVHPSSFEFISQQTRFQYSVVCDAYDQYEAHPDTEGSCEDTTDSDGSVEVNRNNYKCGRLGAVKNPCHPDNKQWSLWSCSDTECVSLEGYKHSYTSRYNTANNHFSDGGVEYKFEHDSPSSKNMFECTTKAFDNTKLAKAGMMMGSAASAEHAHICATGGSADACPTDSDGVVMGEIVHYIETSSGVSRSFVENKALKSKIMGSSKAHLWQNLAAVGDADYDASIDLRGRKWASAEVEGCDPVIDDPANPGTLIYDAACTVAEAGNNEVFDFFHDVQTIEVGCNRNLKLRVNPGVSGALALKVVVKNYLTAEDSNDSSVGYTFYSQKMIPVSVQPKVRSLSSILASGGVWDLGASLSGRTTEAEAFHFLKTTSDTSPFVSMTVNGNKDTDANGNAVVSFATRLAKFSRTTRTYLEVVDCTNSSSKLQIEELQAVPRFRISDQPGGADHWSYGIHMDPAYSNSNGDTFAYDDSYRLYRASPFAVDGNSDLVTDLHSKSLSYELRPRCAADQKENAPDFWDAANVPVAYRVFQPYLDQYHGQYSSETGLCLRTRLYAFEPASCSVEAIESEPWNVQVVPTQPVQDPTIEMLQTKLIWEEDETVPLKISVNHPDIENDSLMWFFGYVDIEDVYAGETLSAADQKQKGHGADFFSYGWTRGATQGVHSDATDAVTINKGCTKLADGKTWRCYANDCVRKVIEDSVVGGFSGLDIADVEFGDSTANVEQCLRHARQTGEAIWGQISSLEKTGVHMRPRRKETKNYQVKVTVTMIDGDAAHWHAGEGLQTKTASSTINLLWVPRSTRYNQQEIMFMSEQDATENDAGQVISFDQFKPATGNKAIDAPRAYRAGAHVCTYVKIGDYGTSNGVDEIVTDTSVVPDHDRACFPSTDVCSSGKCFSTGGTANEGCTFVAGHRVTCEASGADGSRGEIDQIVVFDESEVGGASVLTNATDNSIQTTTYNDGSFLWGLDNQEIDTGIFKQIGGGADASMKMPEQQLYQPAGDNPRAKESRQWYRLEACDVNAGTEIDKVYWCNDCSADGRHHLSGSVLGEAGVCDICSAGEAYDKPGAGADINTRVASSTPLQNSLSFSSAALDAASWRLLAYEDLDFTIQGHSKNFWSIKPQSTNGRRGGIAKDSLCFKGMSHMCTKDSSSARIGGASPMNLRVIAVYKDAVTTTAALDAQLSKTSQEFVARSKSNSNMGTFNLHVACNRDIAEPIPLAAGARPGAWSSDYSVVESSKDYGQVSYLEERNDHSRAQVPAKRLWEAITFDENNQAVSLNYGQWVDEADHSAGRKPRLDCGGQNATSVLCTDRLAWRETTTFHDQHFGRFEVDFEMQKMYGPSAHTPGSWTKANGLFDVYLQYFDNFQNWDDVAPGDAWYSIKRNTQLSAEAFYFPKDAAGDAAWEAYITGTAPANDPMFAAANLPVNDNGAMSYAEQTAANFDQARLDFHDGAGYRISDSWEQECHSTDRRRCVKDAIVQKFPGSYTLNAGSITAPRGIEPCKFPTGVPSGMNITTATEQDKFCRAGDSTQGHRSDQFGSLCQNIATVMESSTDSEVDAYTSTECVFRNAGDVVGLNTYTWDMQVGVQAIANQCYKPANVWDAVNQRYVRPDVEGGYTCPDADRGLTPGEGALDARELASTIRVQAPYRWCNGMRFKMCVRVGNDDRNGEVFRFTGDAPTSVNFASEPHCMLFEPKCIAEAPIAWLQTDLGHRAECAGVTTGDCAPEAGTQALYVAGANKAEATSSAYNGIDQYAQLTQNKAMAQKEFIAGYQHNLRWLVKHSSTDTQAEHLINSAAGIIETEYAWTRFREQFGVSGETVYMTIESMNDFMLTGSKDITKKQRFCHWGCPNANGICRKDELRRHRPVPDTVTSSGYTVDLEASNVNCQPCDDNEPDCVAYGVSSTEIGPDGRGKVLKCRDPYNLQTEGDKWKQCPSYITGSTDESNPGTKYSIKCSKAGDCPEFKNSYISYPADQIDNDVLQICFESRSDWRGPDGWQKVCLSLNVLMKPAISVSQVGFAQDNKDACTEYANGTVADCPTGYFGDPVQPDTDALDRKGEIGGVYEVKLMEDTMHGNPSVCAALSHDMNPESSRNPKPTDALTTNNCFRIFSNFNDDDLTLVAPLGVQLQVNTELVVPPGANWTALTSQQLATSLQLGCNPYTRSSTAAAPNECQGRFVWFSSSQSTFDSSLMYFQETTQEGGLSASREVTASTYQASDHPASKQTWATGDMMHMREWAIFGSDSAVMDNVDYSFSNNKCEPARKFELNLAHMAGYSEAVVAQTRSSMTMTVEDNDFYGRVFLASCDSAMPNGQGTGCGNTGSLLPLNELQKAGETFTPSDPYKLTVAREDWGKTDSTGAPIKFAVGRSRLPTESYSAEARALNLKPLLVELEIDTGGLSSTEWYIRVSKVHGDMETQSTVEYQAPTLINAHESDNPNKALLRIEMNGMPDGVDDCKDYMPGNADGNGHYKCDRTEGSPDMEVPFQFYLVEFVGRGSESKCVSGSSPEVSFDVRSVRYLDTSDIEPVLRNSEIDCALATRNPQPSPANTKMLAVIATQSTTAIWETLPWRVDFAGLDLTEEAQKDTRLPWNAGIDGSEITFPETEHTACHESADGSSFYCEQRELKMHFCLDRRDDEAGTLFTSTVAQTLTFFTSLSDSEQSWSKIHNDYEMLCPSVSELTAIKDAWGLDGISCTPMSTQTRKEPPSGEAQVDTSVYCGTRETPVTSLTRKDGSPYFANTAEEEQYCGADKGRRLLWVVQVKANMVPTSMACPVSGDASAVSEKPYSDAASWSNLPFFKFKAKADDVVNLSKRASLCLSSGKLPVDLSEASDVETCANFGERDGTASWTASSSQTGERCVQIRVQDDEMSHANNAVMNADSMEMYTSFAAPGWDAQNGYLTLSVTNKFPVGEEERQLVNVGVGKCFSVSDSPTQTLEEIWNSYNVAGQNWPLGAEAPGETVNVLGTCDILQGSNFNGETFASLFGAVSAQPTQAEYDAMDGTKLFGYSAGEDEAGDEGATYDVQCAAGVACKNNRFGKVRTLSSGNSWVTSKATVRQGTPQESPGMISTLQATLEQLQNCKDRHGNPIVSVTAEAGYTKYRFSLSTTVVTAQRPDDLNWVRWSPVCTDRDYEISVANTMFAMGGMQTNQKSDLYVNAMRYVGADEGACIATGSGATWNSPCATALNGLALGPAHTCPTEAEYQPSTLKALEYVVNVDFMNVVNQALVNGATQDITTYYGLSAADAGIGRVEVGDNCYGADLHEIKANGNTGGAGRTRTTLTFRTQCMELRPTIGQDPVSTTFVTCNRDNSLATDFSFKMRLWECSNQGDIDTAETSTTCFLLPDWIHVHISLGFIENPQTIEYEVQFETAMSLYRQVSHKLPNGDFVAQGAARDQWRQDNILPSLSGDVPTISGDSALAVSLGLTSGSPLEATMTSAIRTVRLCKFKQFCHLDGISKQIAGHTDDAPPCTSKMLFEDQTHSPYADWAKNTVYDGKGCSTKSSTLSCRVTTLQTMVALPYLTCDKSRWEDFIVAEATHTGMDSKLSGFVYDTLYTKIQGLQPVIEAQVMIDHGMTSNQAESVHGSCEDADRTEGLDASAADNMDASHKETITSLTGIAGEDVAVNYLFPKENSADNKPAGVCTCKSQKARNLRQVNPAYADDNTQPQYIFPYQHRHQRRTIYDGQKYSSDATDPANLHICPWQVTPPHITQGTPLTSQDVFYMSLKYLSYDTTWHFEINAVMFDYKAFVSTDANGDETINTAAINEDQFSNAETWPPVSGQASNRRLLHFPQEGTDAYAKAQAEKAAARRTLSFMTAAANTVVMPQGTVSAQQATDGTQALNSGAVGGFVVVDASDVTTAHTDAAVTPTKKVYNANELAHLIESKDYNGNVFASWNDLMDLAKQQENVEAALDLLMKQPFEDTTTSPVSTHNFLELMLPLKSMDVHLPESYVPAMQDYRAAASLIAMYSHYVLIAFVLIVFLQTLSLYQRRAQVGATWSPSTYSYNFYRSKDRAFEVSPISSFFMIFINEVVCLFFGFYALNMIINLFMWYFAILFGVFRFGLWVVCRIVQKCKSMGKKATEDEAPYEIENKLNAVTLWFCDRVNGMFAIFLDYNVLDLKKYMIDESSTLMERIHHVIVSVAVLFVRFLQVVFAMALLPLSVFAMAVHYIFYWFACIPKMEACGKCSKWVRRAHNVASTIILAQEEGTLTEPTGLACTDWSGVCCGRENLITSIFNAKGQATKFSALSTTDPGIQMPHANPAFAEHAKAKMKAQIQAKQEKQKLTTEFNV